MKQIYYVIQALIHGRGANIIKVVSLGLGLTMSILLFSRVVYEQSFDTCFKDHDKLYQLWNIWTVNGEPFPPSEFIIGAAAGGILDAMPEIVESAASTGSWPVSAPIYNGSVRFDDFKVTADSLFFQTMGIEVLSGDPVRELQQKDVIFLSKDLADKMFGGENPIGKIISFNKEIELTVKGTYAALPENCTMRPKAVISLPSIWSRRIGNYSWNGGDSWKEYIRLKQDIDLDELNKRIDMVVQQHIPRSDKLGITVMAKPVRDTYRGYDEVKRMRNIMLILGISILFITTLNYVLISISSLSRRAKSIGVHKCSGAGTGTVFGMFMWETGIIILLSLFLMVFLMFNFREFVEDTTAAKHYQTDEVIPAGLVEKMDKSGKYGQGFATAEYLAASLLDMDYHVLKEIPDDMDVMQFEAETLGKRGLLKQIPSRYRTTYFNHTMGGGYTAGYYSYIWAEVLDCDAYEAYKETGDIFNQEVAGKFRKYILTPGCIDDAMDMYVNFRGKEPGIDPLLKNRGLK
jgi:hypothetical protein